MDWQPTASRLALKTRADVLATIRCFFAERDVMEVETPLICHSAVLDLHVEVFKTVYDSGGHQEEALYLQTSPEFAMKRLLAAGSGAIYQICHAFRNGGESGRNHNPEFTMLEWYRPGFDLEDLMDETDDLIRRILQCDKAHRQSYQEVFAQHFSLNPHTAAIVDLQNAGEKAGIHIEASMLDKDDWLNLLFSHCIEPTLGLESPSFIYDFPASQAALARIRLGEIPVAERFEVYMAGLELANGYYELTDAAIQLDRFKNEYQARVDRALDVSPIDMRLVEALQSGMPDCAGIALGIDRLILLKAKASHIDEILAFPIERA